MLIIKIPESEFELNFFAALRVRIKILFSSNWNQNSEPQKLIIETTINPAN